MFNRKRDVIKQLVNEIEYYRGRLSDTQDYWQERYDTQSERQQELHEIIDGGATEIKALKQEAQGYVTEYEVLTTVYEYKDGDDTRSEISGETITFKTKADALHFARNSRIYLDEDVEQLTSIVIKKVETRRTALNSDGEPFGRLTESILYGSFFVGS